MTINNTHASILASLARLNQQKFVIGLISFLMLASLALNTQQAIAETETNVSGVEIEILDEPVASDRRRSVAISLADE